MARIRSIFPGLLTDEAFMALTVEEPLAIALYLGLLMESDDWGLFEWKPMTIKARVLPAVTIEVQPLLDTLVKHRFIGLFEAEGRRVGAVRNFCKWQKPKKPNSVHPRTRQIDEWTRAASRATAKPKGGASSPKVRKRSSTGSEPAQNRDGTGTENRRQREEGGGQRKMEENLSLRSRLAPRARAEREAVSDRFRAAFPIKTHADGVRRELDRILDAGEASPEELIAGAARYAKAVTGKDRQHIASPKGWLQDGRWKDDYGEIEATLPVIQKDSDEGRSWEARMAAEGKKMFWQNGRATVRTRFPPDAPSLGAAEPRTKTVDRLN